jgi:NAD(P)H-quinone oxidoreductase subunit 4L
VSLHGYLVLSTLLFGIGLYGLLQRRSLVAMLIALELMLAAVSINVVALTTLTGRDATIGQVVALIIAGVAASETAIALSLFVAIHRASHSIDVESLSDLKG